MLTVIGVFFCCVGSLFIWSMFLAPQSPGYRVQRTVGYGIGVVFAGLGIILISGI